MTSYFDNLFNHLPNTTIAQDGIIKRIRPSSMQTLAVGVSLDLNKSIVLENRAELNALELKIIRSIYNKVVNEQTKEPLKKTVSGIINALVPQELEIVQIGLRHAHTILERELTEVSTKLIGAGVDEAFIKTNTSIPQNEKEVKSYLISSFTKAAPHGISNPFLGAKLIEVSGTIEITDRAAEEQP